MLTVQEHSRNRFENFTAKSAFVIILIYYKLPIGLLKREIIPLAYISEQLLFELSMPLKSMIQ